MTGWYKEAKLTNNQVKRLKYIPNVVGYTRIILLFYSFYIIDDNPTRSICLYSLSTAFDGLDGYLARRLKQTSKFGAWLDVVIDNIGRGFLYSYLHKYGYLLSVVEWTTFACVHAQSGEKWKDIVGQDNQKMPRIVYEIMKNNFQSVAGWFCIGSLHALPIVMYCRRKLVVLVEDAAAFASSITTSSITSSIISTMPITGATSTISTPTFTATASTISTISAITTAAVVVCCVGRLLCLVSEIWFIYSHLNVLLREDDDYDPKSRKTLKNK